MPMLTIVSLQRRSAVSTKVEKSCSVRGCWKKSIPICKEGWEEFGYGPLIDADAYHRLTSAKERGIDEGGKILLGARLLEKEHPDLQGGMGRVRLRPADRCRCLPSSHFSEGARYRRRWKNPARCAAAGKRASRSARRDGKSSATAR